MPSGPTRQYVIEHGSYYLRHVGRKEFKGLGDTSIISMCDQVGIAFARIEGTLVLMRHGDSKSTQAYAKEKGLDHIRLPRGFPVEELNKVISNSSYLEVLLKDIEEGKYDHLGTEIDVL